MIHVKVENRGFAPAVKPPRPQSCDTGDASVCRMPLRTMDNMPPKRPRI